MRRTMLALVVLAILAGGCGNDGESTDAVDEVEDPTSTAREEAWTEVDSVFAEVDGVTLTLDMHFPADPRDAPIVFTEWMVDDLVEEGMIVVVEDDFEPPAWLSGGPEDLLGDGGVHFRAVGEIKACSIRFARERASELGNDDPMVVLTGFSASAGGAAQVALFGATLESRWDQFESAGGPPSQVKCEAAEGSTHVGAFVGVAGAYDWFVPIYDGLYGRAYQQEVDPEVQEFVAGALGANPDLKLRLIHGTADSLIPFENSEDFAAALADAGYDVGEVIPFAGGHDLPPTEVSVSTVLEVLGR